jgi:hypothetical protein
MSQKGGDVHGFFEEMWINLRSVACGLRSIFARIRLECNVKLGLDAFWEAVRYPVFFAAVYTLFLQFVWLMSMFGIPATLSYAALISYPMARVLLKREDNYLKLLLHEH